MARIFYHTATGDIYGVHSGTFSGSLPDGIDFIGVPEAPDQILWPINTAGDSGEKFARVQGSVLVARERPDLAIIAQTTAETAFTQKGLDRAELRLIFELVKAMKTGNQTFFDSVVDGATFKELVGRLI